VAIFDAGEDEWLQMERGKGFFGRNFSIKKQFSHRAKKRREGNYLAQEI